MIRPSWTAAAVVCLLIGLGAPFAAASDASGGACLDPSGLCGHIDVDDPGAGTTASPVSGGGRPKGRSPYRWQRTVTPNACGSTIAVPDEYTQPEYVEKQGTLVWTALIDTRTGAIVRAGSQCIEGPQPERDAAALPMPPEPPGAVEVGDAVPLPRPVVGVNPGAKGLTGLDTWLWGTTAGPETLTVTIRGYTVVATATPAVYTWRMGDGRSYSAEQPGSEANPAAVHLYERKGDYTIEQDVTWRGSFTFSGNDVPPVVDDLGGVTVTSSLPYHVVEVAAVLDDPREIPR